jgi:hypothetical protein
MYPEEPVIQRENHCYGQGAEGSRDSFEIMNNIKNQTEEIVFKELIYA